jgi:hypothetical protein
MLLILLTLLFVTTATSFGIPKVTRVSVNTSATCGPFVALIFPYSLPGPPCFSFPHADPLVRRSYLISAHHLYRLCIWLALMEVD